MFCSKAEAQPTKFVQLPNQTSPAHIEQATGCIQRVIVHERERFGMPH